MRLKREQDYKLLNCQGNVYHLFAYVVAHEVDYPHGVIERDLNDDIVMEEGR